MPDDGHAEKTQEAAPAEISIERSASAKPADYSGAIGGVVWLVVFVIFGYWWFFASRNDAQVFLGASQQPIQISGEVLFNGAPVSKGTVHVVFDDPKKNRYLGGTILPITEGGKFVTPAHQSETLAASVSSTPAPLRVTATFSGQQPAGKDNAPTSLSGSAVLYLNYPAPAGGWLYWCCVVGSVTLAFGLITLFTGDLKQRKARFLFSITYIMTFLSLAVPIGAIVLVSKSQHAVEMMENAPVGLVKGTAKGVQNPQWLVNVGGAVKPAETAMPAPVDKPTPSPSPTPGAQPPIDATRPGATTPVQQQSPIAQENVRPEELRQTPGFPMVRGGLAVPFYVIILAMLGAGINMTKKVPDIQNRYDLRNLQEDKQSAVAAAIKAAVVPMASSGPISEEEVMTVSGIRKDLIDTYMGLISAPFLAIAVYYLLQIVATNIAEPVLVLVAFATGFISDSIVTAITKFASEMIGRQREGGAPETRDHPQGKKGIAAGNPVEPRASRPEGS